MKIDKTIARRQARFQQLIKRRRESHPNETYDAAFAAVVDSEQGQQLVCEMQIANEDAVPVFGPRTAAIVGLRYPQDRALFRETWLRKKGAIGAAPPAPPYPSEADEQRALSKKAGRITDEPKLKEEGKEGFLAEVDRLMKLGHEYSQAWAIAGTTSPGKDFYAQWLRGAAQLKSSA